MESLRKEGWTFTYMGANQDAVEVATHLSIRNSRNFAYSQEGTREMMAKDACTRMNFFTRLWDMKKREIEDGEANMTVEQRRNAYTCMADSAFDEEESKDA